MSGDGAVLVTGSAGAIGVATVRLFLEAGYRVAGFDRRDPDGPQDPAYVPFRVDLRDAAAVTAAVEGGSELGPLLHVIGIAGGALPEEPRVQDDPTGLDPDTFRESLEANLVTQYQVLHAASGWLRHDSGADRSVTLTSSFNALTGCGMPAYSAAKAGLIGLMHALTGPLGDEGIRINVVAPGTIRTPRTERIWGPVDGHFERLESGTALGRLGTPDDVARVYLALARDLTHVTGQVLVVDGGQMVVR